MDLRTIVSRSISSRLMNVIPRATLSTIVIAQVFGQTLCSAVLYTPQASAAERRVTSTQITFVNVTEKRRSYKVACLSKTAGTVRRNRTQLMFLSYSDEESSLKRKRLTASQKSRLTLVTALKRSGTAACKTSAGSGGEEVNLGAYTGTFGKAEAQILYNRFGFGGTPAQIDLAVRTGLAATVNRLLAYVEEPQLDAVASDIECDGWVTGDPFAGNSNRQCNDGNVNNLDRFGMRTSVLLRFINSNNSLFQRLAFFLMDERLSVSMNAARDCERHSIRTYLNAVMRGARSGNYLQYMRDMNDDHLMHLRSLDGGTNRGGLAVTPNENYAREFWELGTVAPKDLSGNAVYSDLDIASSALAFTGWNIDDLTVNGNYTCLASYVPLFHTGGTKTIFRGTPYQSNVEDAESVLQATFRHPRAAEHLAEDLWKEFVNPYATATQIRDLAATIRSSNFNLLPVLKRLMLSRAVYAPKSRRSLIKHPIDLVANFVRTTGFPLNYRSYDTIMTRLEEQPLNAPTVFGWNVNYLSGQQLMIEWWNIVTDYFTNIDVQDTKTRLNYSYYDRFVAGLNAAGRRTASDVIDSVTSDFGIPVTASQKAELDQLMNFYLTRNGCPGQCSGMAYRLVRNAYDTDPGATESGTDYNGQRRLRLLLAAVQELPEARTK